jgi:DNA polymerase III alpha subunit (gram-positive type)
MICFLFDTETSGLIRNGLIADNKQPHIIEFYGCLADLKTGEVISEVDQLIKPPQPISDEITKITKITNDDLEGKPPFRDVADEIRTAIEAAPRVMAHNLSFDIEMVDLEFARLSGGPINWPRRKICTAEATLHLKGYRFKLQGLYEHLFEETFPEAHRARNDVHAMLRCAVKLFEMGEL